MRAAGVSVELLIVYMRLSQEGDTTIKARRDLLIKAREGVQAQLDSYQNALNKLNPE